MKENNKLEIGNKVRMFRKNENGSINEAGRGIIRNFTFDRNNNPTFARVEIFDEDTKKFTGTEELVSINSNGFKITKW